MTSNSNIVNTSAKTFDADVFVKSRDLPVVVDFWAPWCGPCRALAPVLEKLAGEYAGEFVLVKANTDEMPEVAARFNVSGIPAVYAVHNEQIVDFFSGALPESHVRQWLDRVLAAGAVHLAKRLEPDNPKAAEAKYREILAATPDDPDAKLGLARLMLAQQQFDEAQKLISELDERGYLDAEGQKVKSQLALRGKRTADLAGLRAAAQANPNDLISQFKLAEALAGAQQYEEALELLLSLVQRDKKGIGQQARDLMVQVFLALPDDSELASNYRRKLSLALY